MKIIIDTLDLKERVYRMLRDIDDGKYKEVPSVCAGMLNKEQTAGLDALIK
tara:strand:- start:19765 stop:19917 length:153 start_codon:yes stop_codon:yes gene_type:complete